MPMQLEILDGVERGWTYTLLGPDIAIGTTAAPITLTDARWDNGQLRVQQRPGGYQLLNQMPHAILLNGHVLAPRSLATLHDGATIQPTANTLLRAAIVPAARGGSREGVIATPPEAASSSTWRTYAAVLVFAVFIAGGWHWWEQRQKLSASTVAVAEEYKHWLTAPVSEPLGPARHQLHTALIEALYFDTYGPRVQALRRYQEILETIERLHSVPKDAVLREQLEHFAQFVEQCLQRLGNPTRF